MSLQDISKTSLCDPYQSPAQIFWNRIRRESLECFYFWANPLLESTFSNSIITRQIAYFNQIRFADFKMNFRSNILMYT